MTVQLYRLNDPEKETIFENCVADVNIPVGEVFTSPVLQGTNGVLHVSRVYLNGLQYKDLEICFADGMISGYGCKNFADPNVCRDYVKENILFNHETLPLGEFAIGTNTTAYVAGRKYGIEEKYPILIAEKTGPHFAVGDTCYSYSEDTEVYNPDGKRLWQGTMRSPFSGKNIRSRRTCTVTRISRSHTMSWVPSRYFVRMETRYRF